MCPSCIIPQGSTFLAINNIPKKNLAPNKSGSMQHFGSCVPFTALKTTEKIGLSTVVPNYETEKKRINPSDKIWGCTDRLRTRNYTSTSTARCCLAQCTQGVTCTGYVPHSRRQVSWITKPINKRVKVQRHTLNAFQLIIITVLLFLLLGKWWWCIGKKKRSRKNTEQTSHEPRPVYAETLKIKIKNEAERGEKLINDQQSR